MATTANDVFGLAMALLDQVNSDYTLNAQNILDYQGRTPRLLNILQYDLCRRLNVTPINITALTDNLSVTDDVAYRILPYGLAALLLTIEDPPTASFYNQRYEELRRQIPSTWETITDVYADGSDV